MRDVSMFQMSTKYRLIANALASAIEQSAESVWLFMWPWIVIEA
jgi:hypothetical protein